MGQKDECKKIYVKESKKWCKQIRVKKVDVNKNLV